MVPLPSSYSEEVCWVSGRSHSAGLYPGTTPLVVLSDSPLEPDRRDTASWHVGFFCRTHSVPEGKMHESARFEFLNFDQTTQAKTAKMAFANSYVARVFASPALSGLYTVEQLNEFGFVLHTSQKMNHTAVTQELRRIATLARPEE